VSGAVALGFLPNWLGKAELFSGFKGRILRRLGGIPINRGQRQAVVAQTIREFNHRESMVLFVAPEGTRKGTQYWRSGFYYIALGAEVPIVQGLLDYKNKRVGVGQHLMPSGDIEADLEILRGFFADTSPKYPENAAEIRLAPPTNES
jgi:1-acyl-sn-glycerol-3-phosphate acyltransferase